MKKNIILFLSVLFVANVAIAPSVCAQTKNEEVTSEPGAEPEYVGGQEAFRQYLRTSMPKVYPEDREVYNSMCSFVITITADGAASAAEFVQVEGEQNLLLEEMMTEAISKMPKWIPKIGYEEPIESEVLAYMYYDRNRIITTGYETLHRITIPGLPGSADFKIIVPEMVEHKRVVSDIEEEGLKPLRIAEVMPTYVGGETEMKDFIKANLKYPTVPKEWGLQGRVTVRFVVEADGTISETEVLRGIDPQCDKEATRIIRAMPKWNPGMQDGTAVPVYFTIPIVFRISDFE